MEFNELIRDLKCIARYHIPGTEMRKDVDDVVERVVSLLEAQQTRIAQLEAELKEEMYRHDRVQDFEVAEAQELAKLREERRWIPVTERLPESEGCYIVYTARGSGCTAHFYPERRFHSGYTREPGWGGKFAITHWMPLPKPPEEGA